ncbi:MAG: TerC/Alx family metal homeostasis membrane protein [Puniceicoccales bacterium]|jgi:tellurite resistance protein TerC|nr:TerC/Alx family metal homeostasis membrane protein [Puniceicoccales bacterium]
MGLFFANVVVSSWGWAGFLVFIALMLALDLGLFHKKDEALPFRKAVAWCGVWVLLAVVFGGLMWAFHGVSAAMTFAAGYALELALSVDNLFVFLMVFAFFGVPVALQHRVLFWGILGAVVMRGVFIAGGVALVEHFSVLMYVFGAFLVFTGVRMGFSERKDGEKSLGKNVFVRLVRRFFPVASQLHGRRFFVREGGGRLLVTPLFLALVVIEVSDVIFAVDSIPAVLSVLPPGMDYGLKLFVAFTSNIFAILGLRSFYFALSGLVGLFRFLRVGLAFILVFIGGKMVLAEAGVVHVPVGVSLGVLAVALFASVVASVVLPVRPRGGV